MGTVTTADQVRKQFESETAKHQLTVLREDSLYRHLRFREPGTIIYGFDIVTWPGYLAYVGDMGDYLFSRTEDMVLFFAGRWGKDVSPPFDYWAQKLQGGAAGGSRRARSYSVDAYRAQVERWYTTVVEQGELEDPTRFRRAVDDQLLHREPLSVAEAHSVVTDFCFEDLAGGMGRVQPEPMEWDFTEFDHHFLWCCFAIAWGVEQYREVAAK